MWILWLGFTPRTWSASGGGQRSTCCASTRAPAGNFFLATWPCCGGGASPAMGPVQRTDGADPAPLPAGVGWYATGFTAVLAFRKGCFFHDVCEKRTTKVPWASGVATDFKVSVCVWGGGGFWSRSWTDLKEDDPTVCSATSAARAIGVQRTIVVGVWKKIN